MGPTKFAGRFLGHSEKIILIPNQSPQNPLQFRVASLLRQGNLSGKAPILSTSEISVRHTLASRSEASPKHPQFRPDRVSSLKEPAPFPKKKTAAESFPAAVKS
jgi:hypothetical protein